MNNKSDENLNFKGSEGFNGIEGLDLELSDLNPAFDLHSQAGQAQLDDDLAEPKTQGDAQEPSEIPAPDEAQKAFAGGDEGAQEQGLTEQEKLKAYLNIPKEAKPELLPEQGFRIRRFEVYNWGQFHHKIWTLNLNLKNTLLIGNNGSGKSTLADALTTLLVPRRELVYNRAAGAKFKDRTLGSYVQGMVKNLSDGTEFGLRKQNEYSVILAVFYCKALDKTVTLAQFFSFRAEALQPDTIYVGAQGELNIKDDFTSFGKTANDLRRKLRRTYGDKINLFSDFNSYGLWYRRQLNVSKRAVEIFNKCISLKDIPDINSFIRDFMLDPMDVDEMVEGLIDHFNDLTEIHDKIKKASEQIAKLTPIKENADKFTSQKMLLEELELGKQGAPSYVYKRYIAILQRELEKLFQSKRELEDKLGQYQERERELEGTRDLLTQKLIKSGGGEINNLEQMAVLKNSERQRREEIYERFKKAAAVLGESASLDEESFKVQQSRIRGKLNLLRQELDEALNVQAEINFKGRNLQEKLKAAQAEYDSLLRSNSNIPPDQVNIRERICEAIGADERELPFAGELIEVKQGEKKIWEGAIERVLHNFALSMLVPDELYAKVVSFVNTHNLRGRLVFYKSLGMQTQRGRALMPNSMVHKLDVKQDSIFHDALLSMLMQRFNYACCKSEEEYRRTADDALLPSGLYKSKNRNEKDDRRDLTDRRNFVLGWSNADKKALLEDEIACLVKERDSAVGDYTAHLKASEEIRGRIDAAQRIVDEFGSFAAMDVKAILCEIEDLKQKIESLKQNPAISKLNEELSSIKEQLVDVKVCHTRTLEDLTRTKVAHERYSGELEISQNYLSQNPLDDQIELFLKGIYESIKTPEFKLNVSNLNDITRIFSLEIDRQIYKRRAQADDYRQAILKGMLDFIRDYPEDSGDLADSVEYIGDFEALLQTLKADNLPKFEQQFKEKLKVSTLNNMAHFTATLDKNSENISGRIKEINASLKGIDYNYETYIEIHKRSLADSEISQFRSDLGQCLTDATNVNPEDETRFAEEKFNLISNLIMRLKGRAECLQEDEKWRQKVTDVRRWFEYSAMERRKENDEEVEFYSSANAKSGGQKEKLAYTILASALYYQILQQEKQGRPDTALRFIMIDEAFSSGSPNLAEYALGLFGLMGLQVMVITPMTKIGVIEPFVQQIGYVECNRNNQSAVRNFTVEHYKELFEKNDDEAEPISANKESSKSSATLQNLLDALKQGGDPKDFEESLKETFAQETIAKLLNLFDRGRSAKGPSKESGEGREGKKEKGAKSFESALDDEPYSLDLFDLFESSQETDDSKHSEQEPPAEDGRHPL